MQGDLARRAGVSARILQTFNRGAKDGPPYLTLSLKGGCLLRRARADELGVSILRYSRRVLFLDGGRVCLRGRRQGFRERS